MAETSKKQKEDTNTEAEALGEAVGHTKRRPSDATIKQLQENPKKMDDFVKGAETGQEQQIDDKKKNNDK